MQRIRPKLTVKNHEVISGAKPVVGRPILLSNSVYFGTATFLALGIFFLTWEFLADRNDVNDISWFPALLAAIVFFAIAATLHGVLWRRYHNRYLLKREQLTYPSNTGRAKADGRKLTLEKHAAALKKIQSKSEAADSAATNSAEAHLEVYRICGDYLEQVETALPTIRAGSPRLPAFRNGQERVRALQKHHLLQWAEDESRGLLHEAQIKVTINEKVETAQRALEVIEAALQVYPAERQLVESSLAIQEFIAASYVAYWVELAERAAFKENYEQAIDHYRDALFYLSRESVDENQRRATAENIEEKIKRLEALLKNEQADGNNLLINKQEAET